MDQRASVLLIGKPGHMRNALAGVLSAVGNPNICVSTGHPKSNGSGTPGTEIYGIPYTALSFSAPSFNLITTDCGPQALKAAREFTPALILFTSPPHEPETLQMANQLRILTPNARCLYLVEKLGPDPLPDDTIVYTGISFDQLRATIARAMA